MEEFIVLEMEFLAEADRLPEEYRQYVLPPLDDGVRIPCENDRVGDIEIHFFRDFLKINIGTHTEVHFTSPKSAVLYLENILTDQVVFQFHEQGVDYSRAEKFKRLSDVSRDDQVWSGPFKYAFIERCKQDRIDEEF